MYEIKARSCKCCSFEVNSTLMLGNVPIFTICIMNNVFNIEHFWIEKIIETFPWPLSGTTQIVSYLEDTPKSCPEWIVRI